MIAFPTLQARAARTSQPAQEIIRDIYESRTDITSVLVVAIREDGSVEFGCSAMPIARAIWMSTYLRLRIEKEMDV